MSLSKRSFYSLAAGLCLLTAGCGGEETSPSTAENPAAAPSSAPGDSATPTASIKNEVAIPEGPKEGTPPWYLQQIKQVRAQPAKENATLEELRQFRRERNDEIADLATQVIAATHDKPEQIDYFNLGAQELLEARFQNALQGDQAYIDLLQQEAGFLTERDPKSTAAMLAAHALVRYTHTNAQRYGQKDPTLIAEFSRLARAFATNFPEESARAIPLLNAAAMTCEMHKQVEEAKLCHLMLAEKFPDSPQGRFSVGILRRLSLNGRPFEFAGPTLEGAFITIDDYKDKVVLISFWSSDDEDFAEQLPGLISLHQKYHMHGLEIVGVCLDEDEAELNHWLEANPLPWKQIFFVDKEQRRFSNPIVQYYGVRDIPAVWLVNHEGIMQNTNVDPLVDETQIRELLLALRAKTANAGAGTQ